MKYETRLIWVLTITFGFVFFDRNAANFLMPIIADDLHFNNSQIGLVASALSFTWAIASFLGGAYSDRTGNRKTLLLITVVAFSLCSFASGLAVSFLTLFATRLLMGLAEGPILPIAQSLVAIESTAAKRGNNMGVMQNFGSNLLGSFAAPLVLVAVATAFSWRWAFFLSGVPGLIMALLIAKYVRQPDPTTAHLIPGAQIAVPPAEKSMGYWQMLKHRNMWLCMLMAIFMVAWMVLGWVFLPVFYTKARLFSNGQMSHLMSVLGLSAAFFSFVVPALSDRFGRRPVIVIFNFIGLLVPLVRAAFPRLAIHAGDPHFLRLVCQRDLPAVHGHGAIGNHSRALRRDVARHGGGTGRDLGRRRRAGDCRPRRRSLWSAGAAHHHGGAAPSSAPCSRCSCARRRRFACRSPSPQHRQAPQQ